MFSSHLTTKTTCTVETIPSCRHFQRMSTICGSMVRANNPVKIPWGTVISFDYDVDYKPSALVRTQRLSLIPKIPQLEGMHIPSPDVDPHKMSLIKLLLFKPLGQSNDMDEKGIPLDPYRAIFLDAENAQKKLKRGEQENPYDVFPRAWKQYWQEIVLPKAGDAQQKIDARMELPTLWECLEVFQLQKDLRQEKYLIPSDEDCERKIGCDARAKLQNRLTLQEYVCYLTKKLVRNLDAYGRAKAAPKTKSYALDADAKEDPGLQREGVGATGTGEESFEPAFEDALDPDIDGEVRLKASDAPSSPPTDSITAFASHDLPSSKAHQVCERHDLCGFVSFDSRRREFA